jgi:hypothetical protein
MSEENVEIARRTVAAFSQGDVERLLSYIDPEGELHSAIVGGAEGSTYRGHDGSASGSPTRWRALRS